MKPLFGYLFLAIGISFGIASNSFAKISDSFTKVTPSILCIVLFMCITMFSISKAMSALPVGFAYSTYSGLTVTGVVLFAMLKYNQIPNIYGTIGIILIIVGVVMVNYLGKLN
jgi:small multidrug resistance pump